MKKHFQILLVIILFTGYSPIAFSQVLSSPHFTLEKLDEGVWAAIATIGGHGICNAGIIDLGEETLIFDSFMSLDAAEDLKKVALELTGRPAKYLANSHYHNDHIGGNQVFDDAILISTQRTRELIAEHQPEEIEFANTGAAGRLAGIKGQSTDGMTLHERAEQQMWQGYYEAYVVSAKDLRLTLPNLLFDHELTITGTKQTAHFRTLGEGHTDSDLILYLPEKKILFLGDLLFIDHHPWMREGNIDEWIERLDSIKLMDSGKIVPGHGPVGTKDAIPAMIGYFENVRKTATRYNEKNMAPDSDPGFQIPPPYNTWYLSMFYKMNVNHWHGLLKGK